MNVLTACNILSPFDIEEECAHFTITDTEQPFVLNEIAKPDEQYTFSAWVKGSGEISILGNNFPVTAEWTKCVITFISDSTDVEIYFRETGDYYFYNSQLEVGEKDTDYSPAPEDLEADAQSKADNALASAKTYADAQIKASADSVMIAVAQSYATVDTVSGVEKRVTDAEALINVQAGLIEQKVDVDGVIAAINLSKGEARIAADKITLAGYTIADAFTCTNLTVSGNSVFEGVLNGATGVFSGSVEAEKIVISSYIENGDASSYKDTAVDLKNIVNFDGMTYHNNLFMSGYQGIVMSSSSYLTETRGEYGEFTWAITEYGANAYSSLHMGEEKVRPSLFSIDRNGNTIIGSEDVTANLTVTGITKPSVISWHPENSNYDEIQLRLSGSTGTQGISFVTVKDGTTSVFGNIFDANNRFMPDFPVSIYSINTYGFTSSSTVANGSTDTKTATIPAIPSGYTYALLAGRSGYCCMSNYSVSGTTLSVTMMNISGATHTLTLYVTLTVFKNRW